MVYTFPDFANTYKTRIPIYFTFECGDIHHMCVTISNVDARYENVSNKLRHRPVVERHTDGNGRYAIFYPVV